MYTIPEIDLTEINKIVDDFMYSYMSNIANTKHSATGNLALNQTKIIKVTDTSFEVYLELEEYWKYLEYGRKAGKFPPPDKIREWIRIKPVLPRPIKGKLPTTNQLAYLIGRKIAKKGTPATNLLANTKKQFNLKEKLTKAIVTALEERTEKYIKEMLE